MYQLISCELCDSKEISVGCRFEIQSRAIYFSKTRRFVIGCV